uniref:Response regulatory domain-containing protein n=1 Tax=Brassica campestris TaxID=3711 RepID=M4CJC2_BRACM
MAKEIAFDVTGNKISNSNGDTFILLIDHDIASISSLTSMLQQLSHKVISVNVASEAVSMLKKQMDIVLVIANTEMPHIDSHSFYTSLLTRDIPLILISPEGKKAKPSNSLEKRACYLLEKPISEKDINNMLQHVLSNKSQKLTKISIPKSGGGNMEKRINQMKAFREILRRQRPSSFLGKPLLKKSAYQERRNIANVERKNKTVYPVEFENKRNEGNNIDSNTGIRNNFWTYEHQMKFFSAGANLGEKDSHPKSLLGIMNDRTSKNEYPFTLSNIAKNFFADKNRIKERDTMALKFYQGTKMDLSRTSWFGNIPNSSSMEADRVPAATSNIPPCNISPTDTVSHTNLVSTSLNDNNFLDHSGLPSSVGTSNSGEMCATSEDMILSTVQNDVIHCEPSHTSLNSEVTLQSNMTLPQTNIIDIGNATPLETNIEDISQFQQDACYDLPIEDLISFDTDVHEMDMQHVLGNNGSSESQITKCWKETLTIFHGKGLRLPELTLREGYGEEERERDLDGLETEREEDLELDRDDDLETEGERQPRL